jgi:hypothetical protein
VRTGFWIERTGVVTHVSDHGSDLPDPDVVSCIQKSFGELCFPPPEAGLVTVVYPIALSPGSRP